MKFKVLALAAASSLITASFAFAEDASMSLATADNTGGPVIQNNADVSQTTANANPTNIGNSTQSEGTGATPSAAGGNDDMSADTATGDDDY